MHGDREKCLAAGMNDYICKPAKLAELQRVIWQQLQNKHAGAVSGEVDSQCTECRPADELYCRAELLERFEGDEEFVNEIIAMGCDDLPQRLESLNGFLVRQEYAAALLEAHTIKGVAANICANPLLLAAQELELELVPSPPDAAHIDHLARLLAGRIGELCAALEPGGA
jgi:HPt (histidine-containing phosphotransfer) domain-containing protein